MENTVSIPTNSFAKKSGEGKNIKENALVGITQIAVFLIIAILIIILAIFGQKLDKI